MARGLAAVAAVVLFLTAGAFAAIEPAPPTTQEEQTPASDDPATATIERANAHTTKGEYDEALKGYEEALKTNPKSAWAYSARGWLYTRMNKLDLALADLDKALALDLEFEQAWINRGVVYEQLGKFDLAVRDFDAAISLNPNNADSLIERGRCYTNLAKYDLAIADFTAAIAIAPDNTKAYDNRAGIYMWMGKTKEAMADCNEALKHDPKDAFAYFMRSTGYIALEDWDHALQDLDAAIAADPKYFVALRTRGILLNLRGQPARAITDLTAALGLMPDDLPALKGRGDAHFALKHWDLALADYDRLIALKADDASAHALRLAVLVETGKTSQAQLECDKLIADHPGKGWPYVACSAMKRQLGDDKAANQYINMALKIDPSLEKSVPVQFMVRAKPDPKLPPPVMAVIEGLRHLNASLYDEAVADFERATKLGAPDRDVLIPLCKALSHTKRLDEAAYQCSRALQSQPNDGELLETRGIVYFRQGKYKDALADFASLVRIFPQNARYLYERGATKKKLGDNAGGDKDIATAKSMKADVESKVPKAMVL